MENKTEKLINLAKKRGFINQSSEIYGGFSSSYDYGPLGVLLKNKIKELWLNDMIKSKLNILPIDSAIIMSPKVWEASGHVSNFTDNLVECKECHKRFKADDIKESCPVCGGELSQPKKFNILMKTFIGPVEDSTSLAYLRGETCQGIFTNFKWIKTSLRQKIPFGIAQIGKSFRNEITPGNYIFRTREFEQMEMQYFVKPDMADVYFECIKQKRMEFYINIGFKKENLRFKDHEHLAHYCIKGCDIEYHFPFGWQEIEGIHNRSDFDLTQHSKHSKKDLQYFDEEEKISYIPYVIEASSGCDRVLLAVLCDSLKEDKFSFPYILAPYKIAVLPLVKNKETIVKKANQVLDMLNENYMVTYDESGSIGRRYARQDEIGTPYAVTIDFQTLKNNTVTVRDRDTKKQSRVKIKNLNNYFSNNKKSSFIQKIYKILCKK